MGLQKKKVQLDLALEFKEEGEDMVGDGAADQTTKETGDTGKPNVLGILADKPPQPAEDIGTVGIER